MNTLKERSLHRFWWGQFCRSFLVDYFLNFCSIGLLGSFCDRALSTFNWIEKNQSENDNFCRRLQKQAYLPTKYMTKKFHKMGPR